MKKKLYKVLSVVLSVTLLLSVCFVSGAFNVFAEESLTDYYVGYGGTGDGSSKANMAPTVAEAIKTINMNFDLDIEHYVTVNFLALVRVVDQLGGIELNVKNNAMISEINKYGGEIARKNGESFTKVTKTGVQTLNGYQSLG
jgi:anionic cell wall polymer biosynthesis LytR-Cps2A-Psr (LCP) family protein